MNQRHPDAGFTLIEVMIAIAIGGILLATGVPSFSQTISKNRITATSTNLLSDLLLTRSEAIKRNERVVIRRGRNWNVRTVFVDLNGDGARDAGEELILERVQEGNEATIVAPLQSGLARSISYSATGRTSVALNANADFFQINRTDADSRRIRFSATGRPIIRALGHADY